ncbi:fungal specific transcription factor [Colletotrichum truncatum]|uniref:Fungal specific transcription factor n=1 Tax=Colletotrichum truncatum TaxID=5467 RepID=A0ACC3Z1Y7_COLTU
MDGSLQDTPRTPKGGQGTLKELLRSRQRTQNGVRGNPKSCLPCRERKVRCSKGQPCSTCEKRGHPDLCEYESRTSLDRAQSRIRSRTPRLPSSMSPERNHRGRENSVLDAEASTRLSHERPSVDAATPPDSGDAHGHGAVPTTGTAPASRREISFFADSSAVNMVRQRSPQSRDDPARQSAFETGILPLLGMSDMSGSATLSFSTLPSDQETFRLFEVYRQRVQPFHVITCNLSQIEERICALVNARATNPREAPGSLVDPRWLCLLHAILACGAQFSDMPLTERTLLFQKHTTHAFDLLRCTDYLANPSAQAIQTLLLLGNALQNDMKPQAAWVLGGTTIRLAQCLGLNKKPDRLPFASGDLEQTRYLRLAIVWQDALLALAFRRSPASQEMDFEEDLPVLTKSPDGDGLSYLHAMNWLCHVTLSYISVHQRKADQLLQILEDIHSVELSLSAHLINPQRGTSFRQLQEYYAFELHKNFVISTLCRPFISSAGARQLDEGERPVVLERFRDSLRRSVRAYVRLRSITGHARRSWAFIHNGLTSVLLLSLMRETRYLPETRTLQDEMVASLSEGDQDYDRSNHLSDTHRKALKAIQTLQRLAGRDLSSRGGNRGFNNTNDQCLDTRDGNSEPVNEQDPGLFMQQDK